MSTLPPSSRLTVRAKPRNNHPLVVTIDRKSAPRAVFAGNQLVEVDLPVGTRCVYPRPPMEALKDADAAIRYALNNPLGSDPLHARLRPGMKVVIAIDDVSVPLPPMRSPDVRERILTIVLELLADHGVEDVEILIATSIHRRMTADEVRHVVGSRIFSAYWPDRLRNHDAEDPKGMKLVGTTDRGEVVELNRAAVESDRLDLCQFESRADERGPGQIGNRRALPGTRAVVFVPTTTRRSCAIAGRTWTRLPAPSRRASNGWAGWSRRRSTSFTSRRP